MNRINVINYPTDEQQYADPDVRPTLAGWFDADRATRYDPLKEYDGGNMIDVNTHDQNRHQYLYRTAQGRWVLERSSRWQGELTRYEFVDDDAARAWLLLNAEDAAAAQWFGEVEDETGPGRPAIGTRRTFVLPDDMWTWLGEQPGRDRSEALRQILAAAMA